MKAWAVAKILESCGSCRAAIPAGTPCIELRHGEMTRHRCVACAKEIFGEDPPAVIEDAKVPVPQPALPLDLHRGADFVTTKTLARHNQFEQFQRRRRGGQQ